MSFVRCYGFYLLALAGFAVGVSGVDEHTECRAGFERELVEIGNATLGATVSLCVRSDR